MRRTMWAGVAVAVGTLVGMTACETEFVASVVVSRITVEPGEAAVPEGEDLQFTATVLDEHDESLDHAAVLWSSDEPDIVAVASDGSARALAAGSTRVRASFEGVSGTALVVVSSEECLPAKKWPRGKPKDKGKDKDKDKGKDHENGRKHGGGDDDEDDDDDDDEEDEDDDDDDDEDDDDEDDDDKDDDDDDEDEDDDDEGEDEDDDDGDQDGEDQGGDDGEDEDDGAGDGDEDEDADGDAGDDDEEENGGEDDGDDEDEDDDAPRCVPADEAGLSDGPMIPTAGAH